VPSQQHPYLDDGRTERGLPQRSLLANPWPTRAIIGTLGTNGAQK
jgi:hypothetical protein